jgi:hypothetical protein
MRYISMLERDPAGCPLPAAVVIVTAHERHSLAALSIIETDLSFNLSEGNPLRTDLRSFMLNSSIHIPAWRQDLYILAFITPSCTQKNGGTSRRQCFRKIYT